MFFLLFLLDDRRIRIRKALKHMDSTDPYPDQQNSKKRSIYFKFQNSIRWIWIRMQAFPESLILIQIKILVFLTFFLPKK